MKKRKFPRRKMSSIEIQKTRVMRDIVAKSKKKKVFTHNYFVGDLVQMVFDKSGNDLIIIDIEEHHGVSYGALWHGEKGILDIPLSQVKLVQRRTD